MQESETYPGGFSSPFLGKGRRWGYGLAVTDARLIGFKSTWARSTLLAGPAIAAAGGIISLGQSVGSSASLSPVDPSIIVLGTATTLGTVIFLVTNIVGPTREATAGQIEGKKDFEVKKEFVLGIVMRRPQGFGIGHVMIDLQSGDDVKIIIGNKRVFRKTKELVGAFYPEAPERP